MTYFNHFTPRQDDTMTTTTTTAQAFRRLAFLEKVLGPTLQQAQADQARADAAERQRLLAQRTADLKAARQRHEQAVRARAEAEAKSAKARQVHLAAVDAFEGAHLAALNASIAVDRIEAEFDGRLAGLGLEAIGRTVRKLHAMRLHAGSKLRWAGTARIGAAGPYATGKVELVDPHPREAFHAAEAAVAELEALKFDARVTPAEIDASCAAAVQRVLDAGGASTWVGFEDHVLDLSEFRKWQLRTTDNAAVRAAAAAKEE